MRYVLSPTIKQDLDEIAGWIAEESPERAISIIRQIRAEFPGIAHNPLIYRLRPEIGEDARVAVIGRYVVLFRIDGDLVRFERAVFGSRDLPSLYSYVE